MRNDYKSWKKGVQRVGKQLGGALAGRQVQQLDLCVDFIKKVKKQLVTSIKKAEKRND